MLNCVTRSPPTISDSDPGRALHMRPQLGPPRQDRSGVVVDVFAGHAGGHARAHDGADRRSGDRHRPYAKFVERLDDVDMGKSSCPAAAERNGEARARPFVRPGRRPSPLASFRRRGPITRTAGSAVSSFFAAAFTWSSVTASMRAARLLHVVDAELLLLQREQRRGDCV